MTTRHPIITPEQALEAGHPPEQAPRFAGWLNRLDDLITDATGIGAYDWPDWCFADSFEQGDTPEEAFVVWCEDQGWDLDEEED